ncbi:MAG TPA: response regulator [Anaerolineae bacterium]|nr:response regulator [Anaerolineae bacterium]HQI84984.1 response regulator [Anaerolineae bacterium]
MADRIRVMIVDDIAETREQLRKLLSFDPDIDVVGMAGSGEEALKIITQIFPDVVLMDINLPGMDGIATTSKIVEAMPTVQVIMLSVQGETDYMRRAMMAGARDYLTKPPSADELLDAIHRQYKLRQKMGTGPLVAPGASQPQAAATAARATTAKIVTIYSPKGGTGCTTLAVNLAIALQTMLGADSKVCLVDTNLQFGDVAIFMKLQATRTLADLAPHTQDMDSDLLKTILVSHASGVSVLVAPSVPEDAEVFKESEIEENGANVRLKTILEFARREFDYIILDTSHQVDDVILTALDVSDLMVVVTRPVIPEIRGARQFIDLLQKLSYGMDKVCLVINGVDNKRMGIQAEAIERAMMPAMVHIPYDERIALRAANYGEPLILKNARTPIGQAIMNFATEIQKHFAQAVEETVPVSETQKRPGIGRLL